MRLLALPDPDVVPPAGVPGATEEDVTGDEDAQMIYKEATETGEERAELVVERVGRYYDTLDVRSNSQRPRRSSLTRYMTLDNLLAIILNIRPFKMLFGEVFTIYECRRCLQPLSRPHTQTSSRQPWALGHREQRQRLPPLWMNGRPINKVSRRPEWRRRRGLDWLRRSRR